MSILDILSPDVLMFAAALFGIVAIVILVFLRKTETRPVVGAFLYNALTYLFILSVLVILLSFAMKYIPSRHDKSDTNVRYIRGVGCVYQVKNYDREFYNENFSNLLTVLGVIGTLIGVVIPIIGFFVQRSSLKSEVAVIMSTFNSHRRSLAREQRNFKQQLDAMSKELDSAKNVYEALQSRRDYVVSAQLDGIRANLECQITVYKLPGATVEQKCFVIKGYVLQFLDFLRLIALSPNTNSFRPDVARFQEAMKLFRENDEAYKSAMKNLADTMKEAPPESMPLLHLALTNNDYNIVESELRSVFPTIFTDSMS